MRPALSHGEFRCRSSFLFLPHADHGAIASRGNCPVLLAGHLSLLLEAMQDVDGFLEFGDVHHAIDFGPSPPGSPLPCGRLLGMPDQFGSPRALVLQPTVGNASHCL